MLLAHTSAIGNPLPLRWFVLEGEPLVRDAKLQELLKQNDSLKGEPGEDYRYSNLGYWLLKEVIESASGRTYADYVLEHITRPLGLEQSEISFQLPVQTALVTGHMSKWSITNAMFYLLAPSPYWGESRNGWSHFRRLRPIGLSYGGADVQVSAFVAVLADLLKADSQLLTKQSKATMFVTQRLTNGETIQSALGWVRGELNGHPYWGRQGGGIGFHGNVRVYPSSGMATVFFANSTEVSAAPINSRSDRFDLPFLTGLP